MTDEDKYFVHDAEYDIWMHRSPIKCLINPILRKIQFWTDRPLVITSAVNFDEDGTPHFIKYTLRRVFYIKDKPYVNH